MNEENQTVGCVACHGLFTNCCIENHYNWCPVLSRSRWLATKRVEAMNPVVMESKEYDDLERDQQKKYGGRYGCAGVCGSHRNGPVWSNLYRLSEL